MQFKYPELLYALFLLLIPIIVHLFQLRKFRREAFTNVAFLKEVRLQTRKSSQLKKWLTLLTRMLLLAGVIMAFAQPFTTKSAHFKADSETVIYLDNSFSMQAKGPEGELLKRAVQDIVGNFSEDTKISLVTNDNTYRNTSIKAIKNELLQTGYSSKKITLEASLLKCKSLFTKKANLVKNLVFISDFQQENKPFNPETDSITTIYAVQLKPVKKNNICIDTAYISNTSATNIELSVELKNSGTPIENLPVSLYNQETLIAKTSIALGVEAKTTFSLPANTIINGKIRIDDTNLQFDNSLFFNINKLEKLNVLSINALDDSFLRKIYTTNEFNYTSTSLEQLNYNDLDKQHLIVLNELESIPTTLISVLKTFTDNGGYLVIIPAHAIARQTYNSLLINYNIVIDSLVNTQKRVTEIKYSHPLYNNGVFEKQVENFQYPQINSFFNLKSNGSASVLQFEDNKPFLLQSESAYLFTAPLNDENSNFKSSPLIVPTFYNMAINSYKIPVLYYSINKENRFDVPAELKQDDILTLNNAEENSIPKQQYFNNKVTIYTNDEPSVSGVYSISNKNETLQKVSYNYNRNESNLKYQDLSSLENIILSDSITESFDTIKSDGNVNELWKWFVIFALALLLIEMLILKYFK